MSENLYSPACGIPLGTLTKIKGIIRRIPKKLTLDGSIVLDFFRTCNYGVLLKEYNSILIKKMKAKNSRFTIPCGSSFEKMILLLIDFIKWGSAEKLVHAMSEILVSLGFGSFGRRELQFRQLIESRKRTITKVFGSDWAEFSSAVYYEAVMMRKSAQNDCSSTSTIATSPSCQVAFAQDHATLEEHDKESTATNVMDIDEIPNMNLDIEQYIAHGGYFNEYDFFNTERHI